MARALSPLLVVVALVGAGCIGASGAKTDTAPPNTTSSTSSAGIRGTVVNTELVPLAQALVQLDESTPISTGADGRFEILGLEPGEHKLAVQALSYAPVLRKVEVTYGQVSDVQVMLEAVQLREPFVEKLIRDGYDICTVAAFAEVGTFPSPCPLGTPDNAHPLNLGDGWAYFVLQTKWGSSESLWVSIAPVGAGCTTGNPCPGVEISRSPLRIEGAPDDPHTAARYALDGKRTYGSGTLNLTISTLYAGYLREEINNTAPAACVLFWGQFGVAPRMGCPLGFGYSLGLKFTEYVSIFHWERPANPRQYSALPDG